MSPGTPNLFFTFEGIDASGKSLQAQRLSSRLREQGYDVLRIRDPGGTPIAERIRELLLDRNHRGMCSLTELFLYEAARAQLVAEVIQPALEEGKVVISDRFHDSTVAYQGHGRGLSLGLIEDANSHACGGVAPLRTYILDIPWEESMRRRKNASGVDDRMESEKELFFNNVRKAYHEIAVREEERVMLLDGMRDSEEIAEKIYRDAKSFLNHANGKR